MICRNHRGAACTGGRKLAVADAAGRGDLVLPVAATYPLAELAAAHRRFATGVQGRIVLRHA